MSRLPDPGKEYSLEWASQLVSDIELQQRLDAEPFGTGYQLSNVTKDRIVNFETATITGITVANPGVVTVSAAHTIANGSSVFIFGVLGMHEVNAGIFTTANAASTTFEIETTAAFTAYTSGGVVMVASPLDVAKLLATLVEDLKDRGKLAA